MIEYKNKELKMNGETVDSADYIIRLDTDVDVKILGVLLFTNGTNKIVEFINQSDNSSIKIARLITTEKDLNLLSNVKFQLILLNGSMKETTNILPIKFNKELIKTNIKINFVNEYKELREQIEELEDKVNTLSSGKLITKISLVNNGFIKKGMIPVAIDDKGNFAALYPFANNVSCVNGQHAANGIVVIDSSMIEYKLGKTVEKAFDEHAKAIETIANALKEISSSVKDIRKHLDEVDIQLASHINNGII